MEEAAAMRLLSRYLAHEIYSSILLVFIALLSLFAFLDLIHEMGDMHGDYRLGYVMMFVLLTLPGHIYELFPVAVLIGTIVALVQMASHSELTVYRASGASLKQMAGALVKIGLPLVGLCLLTGEVIAPPCERLAQEMRFKAKNQDVTVKEFRSGVWVKDAHAFVNAHKMLPDHSLLDLSIYEFDDSYHLRAVTAAKRAVYKEDGYWRLEGVARTDFASGVASATPSKADTLDWHSSVTPDLLSVLLVVPEQMSIWSLYQYTEYLSENRQKTARYEIAMWNKLIYPFAVLVMMLLALPFASHQRRAGGVSGKIFAGIVLGLTYRFIGKLFSDLGALNDWQPLLSATAMTWLFVAMAAGMLWWTERR
jgi:lipopolysaccharide export system permease protein